MAGRTGKKQFPLRLDPELYEILERWAADELRSVNAHIEYLLRESARRAGRLSRTREDSGGPEDRGAPGERPRGEKTPGAPDGGKTPGAPGGNAAE